MSECFGIMSIPTCASIVSWACFTPPPPQPQTLRKTTATVEETSNGINPQPSILNIVPSTSP